MVMIDIDGKEIKDKICVDCGDSVRMIVKGYCVGCANKRGLLK